MKLFIKSLLFCLLMTTLCAASEHNWQRWRGPDNNGTMTSGQYPVTWNPEKVLWKIDVPGKGTSTPIVWNNRIYLTAGSKESDTLLALDWSGKRLWQRTLGSETKGKHPNASGSNPSPVTDGSAVFVFFKSGQFAAIELDGSVRWQTNLFDRYGKDQRFWDFGTSPVLTKKDVVMAHMHDGDSWLAAFDKKTGEVSWKVPRNYKTPVEGRQGYTTPIVFSHKGTETLLVWGGHHLTAHDASNGKIIWSCGDFNPDKTKLWGSVASPVIAGDVAIVPCGRDDKRQPRLHGIKMGGSGDVTDTHRLWKRTDTGPFIPCPTYYKGRVYITCDRGRMDCINPLTGESLWSGQFPKSSKKFYGSPLVAGDHLYASREDGVIFVLSLKDKFEIVSEIDMGDGIIASPIAVADRLLVRTKKHLFCIGNQGKDPASDLMAPPNAPAEVLWNAKQGTLDLRYHGTKILEARVMVEGHAEIKGGFTLVKKETRGDKVEQRFTIDLSDPQEGVELVLSGTATGSAQAFPAETASDAQKRFPYVRNSVGLSRNLRNNAVYDRQWDWVLVGPGDGKTRIGPKADENDQRAFTFESRGQSIELTFRPRYYQKHKDLEHFTPWTYPVWQGSLTGYCTWWSYRENFTQETLDAMLALFTEKHLPDFGYDYMQFDNCFQPGNGSCPENWLNWDKTKYPGDWPYAIKAIRDAGMKPGIWVHRIHRPSDPHVADIAKAHPDWFVRKADGSQVMIHGFHVLDMTNEAAVDHMVRKLYSGLKDQGWEYVKIDGTGDLLRAYQNTACEEFFATHDTTPEQSLREWDIVAREELGPGIYVLACHTVGNAKHVIGLVDGGRLSNDGFQPRTLSQYNYMEGVVWRNDPDHCDVLGDWLMDMDAMMPVFGTELPVPARSVIRPAICTMAGAALMLSDKLEVYQDDRNIEGMKRSAPVLSTVPGQLYGCERRPAPWWLQEIDRPFDHWSVLARIQWGEKEEDKHVYHFQGAEAQEVTFADLGLSADCEYLVYEFWDQVFLGKFKGAFTAPAMDRRTGMDVFVIREVRTHPWVLSTSRHISQGGISLKDEHWDSETSVLSGQSAVVIEDPYVVTLHLPEGYRIETAEVEGEVVTVAHQKETATFRIVPSATGIVAWKVTCSNSASRMADIDGINADMAFFTDTSCAQLKPTVRKQDLGHFKSDLLKAVAAQMLNGTYDKTYRAAHYEAYPSPRALGRTLKLGNGFSRYENITGLCLEPGEHVVFVGRTHGKDISLLMPHWMRKPAPGIKPTEDPNGWGLHKQRIALEEGLNVIQVTRGGNVYVSYFEDHPEQAPQVQVHFPTGQVNGFFDIAKHTNADWDRLLDGAVSPIMDARGRHIQVAYPVEWFNVYTRSKGVELINNYDTLLNHHYSLMGLVKYDKLPRNRILARVNFNYYMFRDGDGVAYLGNKGTMRMVADPEVVISGDPCWGFSHEVGHALQMRQITWGGMTEVSNNIFSMYTVTAMGNASRLKAQKNYISARKNIIESNPKISFLQCKNVFDRLVPFWQLHLYFARHGRPDFYGDVMEQMRLRPDAGRGNDSILNQFEFVKICCDVADLNLMDFFDAWGFFYVGDMTVKDYGTYEYAITQKMVDDTKSYIANKKYKKPAEDITLMED